MVTHQHAPCVHEYVHVPQPLDHDYVQHVHLRDRASGANRRETRDGSQTERLELSSLLLRVEIGR